MLWWLWSRAPKGQQVRIPVGIESCRRPTIHTTKKRFSNYKIKEKKLSKWTRPTLFCINVPGMCGRRVPDLHSKSRYKYSRFRRLSQINCAGITTDSMRWTEMTPWPNDTVLLTLAVSTLLILNDIYYHRRVTKPPAAYYRIPGTYILPHIPCRTHRVVTHLANKSTGQSISSSGIININIINWSIDHNNSSDK